MRHCRNVLEVARGVMRHGGETTAVLHDGTAIAAPEARTLLPLLEEIFIERAYDTGTVCVRPGDVVVDIGAHVGAFTIFASLHGAARIIALEPSPLNAAYFRRNIERNHVTRVELVEAAVGALEGRATLALGRFSVGNVLVEAVTEHEVGNTVDVRTTTLAGIFAEHRLDRIDFLKIDCEGSEGALLSAAPPELLARVDRMALEYHDRWSSLDHTAIARLLEAAGFTVSIEPPSPEGFGMMWSWRSGEGRMTNGE
jgi:FkbM family methyltransferase